MSAQLTVPAEKQPCNLHKNHGTSRPLRTVAHHIFPKEWGGDEHGPKEWTCDNGHYSTHRILDWFRLQIMGPKGDGVGGLPVEEVLMMRPPFGGALAERALARKGIRMWVAAGRPK